MAEGPGGATRWRLEVGAGPRARAQASLAAALPAGAPDGAYVLVGAGAVVPAQADGGELCALLPRMAAGEERTWEVRPAALEPRASAEERDGRVAVRVGGTPVGDILLAEGPKPFLYPLCLPDGTSVVRRYPPDRAAGDVDDHPHHRGLWAGHGDVNGADCWAGGGPRPGRARVRRLACASGPVLARVELELEWVGPDERPVARERRVYRFWDAGADARWIDIASTYAGPEGAALRFGDTKEGALCCIRLAAGMEGNRGGLITTAEGARTEAEAWGSAAGWCDCSGRPLLADGRSRGPEVGVAIFDHPGNPLHPTRWHARDYGLMTANPFALHDYMPGRGLSGEWVVPVGGEATFRYRVYAHTGDALEAGVAARYADWAWPVRARLTPA